MIKCVFCLFKYVPFQHSRYSTELPIRGLAIRAPQEAIEHNTALKTYGIVRTASLIKGNNHFISDKKGFMCLWSS